MGDMLLSNKILLGKLFRVYVLSCLYTPLLVQLSGVNIFQLVDDVVFLSVFLICVISLFSGLSKIGRVNYVLPFYILFSCFVSVLLENSLLVVVLSLKNMKNLFLIFIMVCLIRLDFKFVTNAIKFMLYTSVPVALFQFSLGYYYDDITGLFGPKSSSLYSLTAIVFFVVEYLEKNKNGDSILGWYWIWLVPVFLNETKISFVLLPLLFVYLLFVSGRLKVKSVLSLSVLSVLSLVLVNSLYQSLYGYSFTSIFNYDFFELYFLDYTPLHGDVPRLYRLIVAYELLSNGGLLESLFGYGIGSVYVGDGGGTLGSVSRLLEYTALNSGSRIQLFQILIDYGFIGTAVFIFYLIYCLVKFSTKAETVVELYAVSFTFVMLICLIYQNMFFTKQLSFIFFYYLYVGFISKIKFSKNIRYRGIL